MLWGWGYAASREERAERDGAATITLTAADALLSGRAVHKAGVEGVPDTRLLCL